MSKKQKRIVLYTSPIAVLVALALVVGFQAKRIDSEALIFAETGKGVLALFSEHATALAKGDLERALACYLDDYASPQEGVWVEELESERDGVARYQWSSRDPGPFDRDELASQLAGFMESTGSLTQAKLKLSALEEISRPGAAVVRSILWLRGERPGGESFESHATFRMWLEEGPLGWKISRRQLLEGETVTGSRQGFVDVATDAGLDFETRINPLFSTPEWNLEKFGILKYGAAGVSAIDIDGDGWEDLFFGDGEHPRLFRNRGDGTFEDVTAASGLPTTFPSANVGLFADLDNDGDKDFFMSGFTEPSRLYANRGDGTFEDVTAEAGLGRGFVVVAAAGDYDGDSLLDLYLGRYLDPRTELPTTLFYTRNSEGNSLLKNEGGLRFRDVTAEAGVREGGLTLGVAWGDVDGDRDLDLYVANDFGRNALFANQGDGTFADVSTESGTLDFGFGMAASFGDIDDDGDLDLYISNVHSGQRWYGQAPSLSRYLLASVRQRTIFEDFSTYREIFSHTGADWRIFGDQMVKGNSLMLNDGEGHFTDVAEVAGANPFGWYWGSGMFDYDNDGRQDVYAVNGWISGKRTDDL